MEDIFLLGAVTSMLLLRAAAARGTSVISDTERDGRFVDAAKSAIDLRLVTAPFSGEGGARLLFGGKSDPRPF